MKYMQRVSLIAAPLLALGSTAHAADRSTIFGMELQKPFTVHECPYAHITKKAGYYNQPTSDVCYELIGDDNAGKNQTIVTNTVKLVWPSASKPTLVGNPFFAVGTVIDGNLEGVSFNTMGIQAQERDLQLLVDKFGEPTAQDQPTVQNGYGAKLQSVRAQWDVGDVVVSYDSAGSAGNSGLVHIDTLKSAASRKAALAKYEQKGPAL